MIPFIDLQAQRARLGQPLEDAILKVVRSGAYIMGPEIAEFERQLCAFGQAPYALSCGSGTEALVLPQFMEFRFIHLLGTYWAIILPAIAAPVAVFVFYTFLKQIPMALIEAARVEGASWWRVYYQICMPLCRPAVSAVAILTFISTWNGFLWPLLVLTQTKSETITVGLASLIGGSAIQYAETMASAVLGFLPLLAVFLLLQRQIVQGVANTGIK